MPTGIPRKNLRTICNNYYISHFRILTLMSLVMDEVDDLPFNSTFTYDPYNPVVELYTTLGEYLYYAMGAWLYQLYAPNLPPHIVGQAYGITNDQLPGIGAHTHIHNTHTHTHTHTRTHTQHTHPQPTIQHTRHNTYTQTQHTNSRSVWCVCGCVSVCEPERKPERERKREHEGARELACVWGLCNIRRAFT